MRLALLALAMPVALSAQTMADNTLCDRVGSTRYPETRTQAQQLAKSGGARGTFFTGCLLLADEKPSEAAEQFAKVVQADDRNAVAHFFLGRAYGDQAEHANIFKQASLAKKTKNEFDRAVQLDPEYLDAREGLMEYYLRAPGIMGGSKPKAHEQVEEIRKRDPYRGGMLASRVAGRDKDDAGMFRELQQLTTQFPDSVTPWLTLAYTYAARKQWADAFATVDRLQKALPNAPVAQYAVGRLAGESGQQLDRGEQSLRRYLTHTPGPNDPPLANAHWRLGAIHERRGQKDAARAEYQTAVAMDPKLTAAKDALAKLK